MQPGLSTLKTSRHGKVSSAGKILSMSDSPDFAADLEFVKALAQEAAGVALARCRSVTPHEKENLSYVTDLDQDLECLIRGKLGARFPDDVLTGEEYGAGGGSGPRRWSIDPIDGTGNLVHGLPLWAISIGLIADGEPVLGVIAVPPLGELFWAVKGCGAWLDGHRLAVRDADAFHNQDNVCVGTNALRAVDPRSLPGRLRDLGSACCEQAFVAANRLQACTFLGEATHDVAAGIVIAVEAGCHFGTIAGERLSPAEMVRRTPVTCPTFVAAPRRLDALMAMARPLDSRQ
jgi:fructose-1,6-bisphosphatase/inositol monophosphatase family enzyme